MSTDETYNGWKNYPTWAVNLWLSNDEGLSIGTEEIVRDCRRTTEAPRTMTADALKTWVRDVLAPDLGASFAADLLGYAFDLVDWYEIADAWIENSVDAAV